MIQSVVKNKANNSALQELADSAVHRNDGSKNLRSFLFLPALLIAAILVGSVCWLGLALPSIDDPNNFACLRYKHQLLTAAKSPKLVFIGDSNLLMGLDGQAVHNKFGKDVVNMGLCINFGLPFVFEEVKDQIKQGDIIILSPEYPMLSNWQPISLAPQILDAYPEAFAWILRSSLNSSERLQGLFSHLISMGTQKIKFVVSNIAPIVEHKCSWTLGKVNPDRALSTKNMDQCGDLLWHLGRKNAGANKVMPLYVPQKLDPETIDAVNDFGAFCKSRQAQLVIIPAPVPQEWYQSEQALITTFTAQCRANFTAPILGDPTRYAFPYSMIFEGHYHLNKEGRALRTEYLVQDLERYLDQNIPH